VGTYVDASGNSHGFLESGGSFTTIDYPGANGTFAVGINNAGQVVGSYWFGSGSNHGFLESGGSFTTIDVPGASSTLAHGINDAGQVVGAYFDDLGLTHGFLLVLQNIEVTSLAWNSAQGGADFSYAISNGDLPQATTVDLYWAPTSTFDQNEDTLIPGSVTTTQTVVGTYGPIHVDAGELQAPAGDNYLLAVADPDHLVETGDHTFPLAYDPFDAVAVTTLDSRSLTFQYDISEAQPSAPFDVGIYRSSSDTFDPSGPGTK